MNEEIDEFEKYERELYTKYPELFALHDKPFFCGVSVPRGWRVLVDALCASFTPHLAYYKTVVQRCAALGKEVPQNVLEELEKAKMGVPVVHQIKEKFGGLRFYADKLSENDQGAIKMAEILSERTCAHCGTTDKVQMYDIGWVLPLCDKHADEKYGADKAAAYRDRVAASKVH